MRMSDYLNEMTHLVESFPDLNISWKNIHQVGPGKVEIGFFQIQGTHTGKPCGFEPHPQVQAQGQKIKSSPGKNVCLKPKEVNSSASRIVNFRVCPEFIVKLEDSPCSEKSARIPGSPLIVNS